MADGSPKVISGQVQENIDFTHCNNYDIANSGFGLVLLKLILQNPEDGFSLTAAMLQFI